MSTPMWLSFGALWGLVIFQGLVLLGLVRAVYTSQVDTTVSHALDGSGDLVGSSAPSFETRDISGVAFDSAELEGMAHALLFVSPRCRSCAATPEEMRVLEWKAEGEVLVVCRGSDDDCAQFAATHDLHARVLIDDAFEISREYRITSVPTAVIIDSSNTVRFYGNPMREQELIEISDEDMEVAVDGRLG
ncbi:MAG TPA: redoxin domain-containing protein [Gaiellaceae bacterium]|nr:redoxin domain-containing protein [Gaiellaceae bacterium]